jgi:Spermidine synthase
LPHTVEIHDKGIVGMHLRGLTPLVTRRTARALVEVFRHPELGRVLITDGEIQHVEAWAPLYHEVLVHVPIAFVAYPRRALVLGGGSFFAAAEILKYQSIEEVVMIDHDLELLDCMCEIYPHAAAARADKRLSLIVGDLWSTIGGLSGTFDLIVNDAVNLLHDPKFDVLAALLTSEGVCGDVIYRHVFDGHSAQNTIARLSETYHTAFSLVAVPEYPGVLHLLAMWGRTVVVSQKRRQTLNREQAKWLNGSPSPCEWYDPRFLPFYLYLPPYLRRVLTKMPA